MNRRIFAAALACALSLSLLASCGSKPSGSESGSVSGSSSVSSSADGSTSTPDVSTPDGSVSEELPDASQPIEEPVAVATLTLNQTDFTLKSMRRQVEAEVHLRARHRGRRG